MFNVSRWGRGLVQFGKEKARDMTLHEHGLEIFKAETMEAKNLVVVQRCQRSGEDVWPNLLQLAVTENELRPGLEPGVA